MVKNGDFIQFVLSKTESFEDNVALAITGGILGTFKEKVFNELGLESGQN